MLSGVQYQPLHSKGIEGSDEIAVLEDDARQRRRRTPPSRCWTTILIFVLSAWIVLLTRALGKERHEIVDGQSPPWYPSPRGGTVQSWRSSYQKAQLLVQRMTLVEKVNITTGTGWAMNLCVGNTGPALGVGFPSLCLQDGPLGIRFSDHTTSFPAGITVGSTWNRQLIRRKAAAHAREAKIKGVNVLLGPSMGALGRNPAGGRTWEGFGSDPVLQAVAAYETIIGIQSQGVMATAKHFVGNEQEHFRKSFEWGLPEALSSNIDDRTMHEIYAWPFAESIRAGVASVMCSYQMVNNSYACQNSKLLNGILKDEMGFQGFVQSDWLAQRSGVASALAGLDMTMPGDGIHKQDGKSLYGEQLTIAVLNGSVPLKRLNDMAVRVVAAWYQLGQDKWEKEGPNFSSWTKEQVGKWHDAATNSDAQGIVNKFFEASNHESREVAREVAAEGTVLLKNDGILPLDPDLSSLVSGRTPRIMIVGEDAGPGDGPNVCQDRSCNQGTLAVGWGSGATEFTYLVDPSSALKKAFKSIEVSSSLSNGVDSGTIRRLRKQDVCIVFANAIAGEGYLHWKDVHGDRPNIDLQKDGSHLIKSVTENCGGPVIAVIHAVGPVILEEFVNLPNLKAIVFANLPGQESGNALADVLLGKVDVGGRLAFTLGKTLADYGATAKVLYYPNAMVPQVNFSEGVFFDYRHFDRYGIEPRYPFGYGLSYTQFELSDLVIKSTKFRSEMPEARVQDLHPPEFSEKLPDPTSALFPRKFFKLNKYVYPYISSTSDVKKGPYPYPDGYYVRQNRSQAGGDQGGNPSLFETHVMVQVRLQNIGHRTGKHVVQLYVTLPENAKDGADLIEMPKKVLRNFEKVELRAGEAKTIVMNLTRKDLSYWSTFRQNWVIPNGTLTVHVGHNSRDLPLSASIPE